MSNAVTAIETLATETFNVDAAPAAAAGTRAPSAPSSPSSLSTFATRVMTFLRSIGPYAAIELVLPGGTVIALLIWLYRNRQCSGNHA